MNGVRVQRMQLTNQPRYQSEGREPETAPPLHSELQQGFQNHRNHIRNVVAIHLRNQFQVGNLLWQILHEHAKPYLLTLHIQKQVHAYMSKQQTRTPSPDPVGARSKEAWDTARAPTRGLALERMGTTRRHTSLAQVEPNPGDLEDNQGQTSHYSRHSTQLHASVLL